MAYVTSEAMVAYFGEQELIQLTDSDNSLGGINTARLAAVIADAEAEIDSYVGAKYTLPLTVVPRVLNNYAADITRYRLYTREAPEPVRQRYADAVKWLGLVARGAISLGLGVSGTALPESGSVKSTTPARVFSAATLADY